jgi:hypothetical protein
LAEGARPYFFEDGLIGALRAEGSALKISAMGNEPRNLTNWETRPRLYK